MSKILAKIRKLRTYFHSELGVIRAVDGVNLDVHGGRTLCVVGESGSGKSVTAMSLLGLVDEPGQIEGGSSIRLDGVEVSHLEHSEWERIRGRDVAMIFQEPMTALDPVWTVGSQIAEAVQAHGSVAHTAVRERVLELMTMVGIPSPAHRISDYPHQMSGGMRQRVMIAAALASNPKLLIADEPTTALDVTVQAQILDLLRDLQKELNMAILMITHDFGVVSEMADDVAVMYAGEVIETGPVYDIIRDPMHPYTEALLNSVPTLGMDSSTPLPTIPGVVPSAMNWPTGCRFAKRCRVAEERCFSGTPELKTFDSDRAVACFVRYPEGASEERQATDSSKKDDAGTTPNYLL